MKRMLLIYALVLCAFTVAAVTPAAAQTSQTMINSPGGVQVTGNYPSPSVTEFYYSWTSPDRNRNTRPFSIVCAHGIGYRLKINDSDYVNCARVTIQGRIPKSVKMKRRGRTYRITATDPPKKSAW